MKKPDYRVFAPVFGKEMREVPPEEVARNPEGLPLPEKWIGKINKHWGWKLLPPALVLVMWYSFGYLLYTRAIDRATCVQLTGVVLCIVLAHYNCLRKNR